MSLGSQSSRSYKFQSGPSDRAKGNSDSESGLVLDSKSNGLWQKLDKTDVSNSGNHNVVSIAGGMKTDDEDLEAQQEGTSPLKIAVKKGFGTDY